MEKVNELTFFRRRATLSWTYQAANNLIKCPQILPHLIYIQWVMLIVLQLVQQLKKKYFLYIGDGSVPMNSQEMFG